MCGINGILQFNRIFNQDKLLALVHSMNEKIIHRGPDSEGVFADDCCGIGMRRLSIIDLSTGNQPIWNEDETLGIVFNGEIYNYIHLRNQLVAEGCVFKTKTDTEVILKGYEQYGPSFVNELDGMFVFCIYNRKKETLFVARDRAGEKPLYYAKTDSCFIFSSELKSIISTELIKKKINLIALRQYFQLTYIPSPLTIYEDIYKLNPGNYITVDSNANTTINPYWDLSYSSKDIIEDYNVCKNLLRNAVFSSVEKCLVADVPVGAFLSGGIDSSIITGLASQISSKPIDTFTIGFSDKSFDESKRADITARKYHTNHHVSFVDNEDLIGVLPDIFRNMDEPFADTSLIVTHIVAKNARSRVKTVLTGDAGDELFAGYNRYNIGYYGSLYNRLPKHIRHAGEEIIGLLPKGEKTTRKINKFLRIVDLPLRQQRIELMRLGFSGNKMPFDENIDNDLDFIYEHYDKYISDADEINRILYTDFKVSLEGDMLTKVDRASMLASLETRVPLLTKEVLEVVSRIPGKYKLQKNKKKVIFKDAFHDIIPNELKKAAKRGFDIPINSWLKRELRYDVESVLNRKRVQEQGILDSDRVDTIVNEHLNDQSDRPMEVWCLYVFEKWWEYNMV